MTMQLLGTVCDAGGAVNEDAAGFLGEQADVKAAWVLDGVTGINAMTLYEASSDAAWFVSAVNSALLQLLAEPVPLPAVMSALVERLVAMSVQAPGPQYDPPACCLLLVREHEGRWDAARIGDSCLLVSERSGAFFEYTDFPLQWLDRELKLRSSGLRLKGLNQAELVERFRPMIMDSRRSRNRSGGYGILEADLRCLDFVQYIAIKDPASILLCTDGFYRLVDSYGAYDDEALLEAAGDHGPEHLLRELRAIETADPDCIRYPRFKPRDDATATCLIGQNGP